MKCSSSFDDIIVHANEDICFGSWSFNDERILFGKRMPTSMVLSLETVNTKNETLILSTDLHTSCSKPLNPPYAMELSDSCDDKNIEPFILSEDFISNGAIVKFSDGFSIDYYNTFMSLEYQENDTFDFSFGKCSCDCKENEQIPTDAPSLPLMTQEPSYSSFSSAPSDKFDSVTCNDQCMVWVSEHCVIPGDEMSPDQKCIDPSQIKSSRFLRSEDEVTVDEHIEYHKKMEKLFNRLLYTM
mmetsp:Transcript_19027/g.23410  ORF Transcript_19027/g.23410 Transcript_19027/m.23410 type:complete len:242 (+) Transcript_19027:1177-1902(+)